MFEAIEALGFLTSNGGCAWKLMLVKSEKEMYFTIVPVLQNNLSPLSFTIRKERIFVFVDFILWFLAFLTYLLSSYLFHMLHQIHSFAEMKRHTLEIKQG